MRRMPIAVLAVLLLGAALLQGCGLHVTPPAEQRTAPDNGMGRM